MATPGGIGKPLTPEKAFNNKVVKLTSIRYAAFGNL